MFSGKQLCQGVKVLWRFRDELRPHLQGVADGLVEPKLITGYIYIQQHALGHLVVSFGSTKPSAKPWRWGRIQSLKRQGPFTLCPGSLSEKSVTYSVAARDPKHKFYVLRVGKRPLYFRTEATAFEWQNWKSMLLSRVNLILIHSKVLVVPCLDSFFLTLIQCT